MKTILLHVYGDDGQASRVRAAVKLARAFEGTIQCVQVSPLNSYVVTEPFGGMYMVGQLFDALERQSREDKAAVDVQISATGIAYEWIGFDGGVSQSINSGSRLSDLIVRSRIADKESHRRPPIPIASDVALHARTPVLCLPVDSAASFDPAAPAVIAWNGSPEAANALRATVPLLAVASSVAIATVNSDDDEFPAARAIAYLALHGISANHYSIEESDSSVADSLTKSALSLGAGYIVMGAYGHSRLREAVLGGVTRSMLEHCPLPLVLTH